MQYQEPPRRGKVAALGYQSILQSAEKERVAEHT